MALAERLLQRVQVLGVAEALDGEHLAPSAWTASIRQERTATPSTITVHAPQTPCSHPRWVPVSPSSSRRKSASVIRTSAVAAALLAVDDDLDLAMFTMLLRARSAAVVSARRTATPARWRRYSADPWMSRCRVEVASPRSAAAALNASAVGA